MTVLILFVLVFNGLITPSLGNDQIVKNLTQDKSATPIDQNLGGVETSFSKVICELIQTWSSQPNQILTRLQKDQLESKKGIVLEGFNVPDQPFTIALRQTMKIHAPLSRVESILDDFEHYKDLSPDFEDITVVSQTGNKFLTHWEQHIPVFFLPNIHYELLYAIDKTDPNRRMYRYQLKTGDQIKSNDGLIVIESLDDPSSGQSDTLYSEFDFFEANWGILKASGANKIWKASVEGIYLSDLAIKLRAENPSWSYERIKQESRSQLDKDYLERIVENKSSWKFGFVKK